MRLFTFCLILCLSFHASGQSFSVATEQYGFISGISNTFTVNVEGVFDDSVYLSVSTGVVNKKRKNQYAYTSDSTGVVEVIVYAIIQDSIKHIGSIKENVKPFPIPTVTASGLKPGLVAGSAFVNTSRLIPDMNIPGLILCGVQPKIVSYDVMITTAEYPDTCIKYTNVGGQYAAEFWSTFKYLVPGDRIVFTNIRAETALGSMDLQPIEYRLKN